MTKEEEEGMGIKSNLEKIMGKDRPLRGDAFLAA